MAYRYFNITFNCQCQCVFCAANVPLRKKRESLRFQDIMIASLNTVSGETIVLSGGEPTLHPGLETFVRNASNLGARTILQTNGLRMSNMEYARKLVTAGISEVGVPLYGASSTTHDALTLLPGSFEDTIKGISNILELKREMDFPIVEIKLLVSKPTLLEHDKILDLISQKGFSPNRILLKFMVQSDTVRKNLADLFLSFVDSAEGLHNTIKRMEMQGFDYWLAGIPLCILKADSRSAVVKKHSSRSVSFSDATCSRHHDPQVPVGFDELIKGSLHLCPFFNQCHVGELCPGPEETYVHHYGTHELHPIQFNENR